MPNPIALAIPFFFLLIGVELWAAARAGVKLSPLRRRDHAIFPAG